MVQLALLDGRAVGTATDKDVTCCAAYRVLVKLAECLGFGLVGTDGVLPATQNALDDNARRVAVVSLNNFLLFGKAFTLRPADVLRMTSREKVEDAAFGCRGADDVVGLSELHALLGACRAARCVCVRASAAASASRAAARHPPGNLDEGPDPPESGRAVLFVPRRQRTRGLC